MVFILEREEMTAIITPLVDLTMARHDSFRMRCRGLEGQFASGTVRNVVVDCKHTELFGCMALGRFLRLSRLANRHGGIFALCGLSSVQQEVIWVARLHRLWPIYSTRDDALRAARDARKASQSAVRM